MEKINPFIIEEWTKVNIDGIKKDYYSVSNFGRVKNSKDQIIKPRQINTGYFVYSLYTGIKPPVEYKDKYKRMLAHRLVKYSFDPIDNFSEITVNHIDHNKANNSLYNLNYMTQYENNEDSINYYHSYGQEKIKSCTFSNDQLIIIVKELKKNTPYKEILSMIGIEDTWNNRDYIGNIKRGRTYQRQINELKMYGLID